MVALEQKTGTSPVSENTDAGVLPQLSTDSIPPEVRAPYPTEFVSTPAHPAHVATEASVDPRLTVMNAEFERLDEVLERQGVRLRGAQANLERSRDDYKKAGIVDNFLGVSAALGKQFEADNLLAETLRNDVGALGQRRTELAGLRDTFLKTEALGRELEQQGRLPEAQEAYNRAQLAVNAFAERSGQRGVLVPSGYQELLHDAGELSHAAVTRANTTETVLKTTQKVVVIAGATIATGGAAGGVLAAGGGMFGAMGAGLVAGMEVGTAAGMVVATTEGTSHWLHGTKSGSAAVTDAATDFGGYVKDSVVASAGTALGVGAAAKVSGVVFGEGLLAASTGTKVAQALTVGTTAGGVAAGVSTTVAVGAEYGSARQEFAALADAQGLSGEARSAAAAAYFAERGLSGEAIAKRYAFDIGIGVVSGGAGGGTGLMLQSAQTGAQAARAIGAQLVTDTGVGIGAAALSGDMSAANITQSIEQAVIGGVNGVVAHQAITKGAAGAGIAPEGTPQAPRPPTDITPPPLPEHLGGTSRPVADPMPPPLPEQLEVSSRVVSSEGVKEAGAPPPINEVKPEKKKLTTKGDAFDDLMKWVLTGESTVEGRMNVSAPTEAPPVLQGQARWDEIPHAVTQIRRATVEEHGPRLSAAELDELRHGPLGALRPDLDPTKIAAGLNAQLRHHSVADVDAAINQLGLDRPAAEAAFGLVTQHGSLQQLDGIAAYVSHLCARDEAHLLVGSDTSLGSNLYYLGKSKGVIPIADSVDQTLTNKKGVLPNSVVVLDAGMLERIRTDKQFRNSVRDPSVKLVTPVGWEGGVTPFNAPDITEVVQRVDRVVRAAGVDRTDSVAVVQQKIESYLKEQVRAPLREAAPDLVDRVEFVSAARGRGATPTEAIAEQLNGRAGIAPEQLRHHLNDLPPEYRAGASEILAREARFFSHHTLAVKAREHLTEIYREISAAGIAPDDVTFFVPEPHRSFSLAGMAYEQASDRNLHFSNRNSLPTWIRERADRPSAVVVLDDVAGSGQTMVGAQDRITTALRGEAHQARIVLAPLISAETATRVLSDHPSTEGAIFVPGERVPSGRASPFACSLDRVDRARYQAALGCLGYEDNASFVAFPHMSPDNNSGFGGVIADYVTLQERAVKKPYSDFSHYRNSLSDGVDSIVSSQALDTANGIKQAVEVKAIAGLSLEQVGAYHDDLKTAYGLVPNDRRPPIAELFGETSALVRSRAEAVIELNLDRMNRELNRETPNLDRVARTVARVEKLVEKLDMRSPEASAQSQAVVARLDAVADSLVAARYQALLAE